MFKKYVKYKSILVGFLIVFDGFHCCLIGHIYRTIKYFSGVAGMSLIFFVQCSRGTWASVYSLGE